MVFDNCCRIEQRDKMLRQNPERVHHQVRFGQPYCSGFGHPNATTDHSDINIV